MLFLETKKRSTLLLWLITLYLPKCDWISWLEIILPPQLTSPIENSFVIDNVEIEYLNLVSLEKKVNIPLFSPFYLNY